MIETTVPARARAAAVPPPTQGASASDSEDRRAHILAAAQRVFEAKGLEGANMRAIAKEAGYTRGRAVFLLHEPGGNLRRPALDEPLAPAGRRPRRGGGARRRGNAPRPARWRFTITTPRGPTS